ncbi:MAG TPA: hypothetical protein VFN10_02790 [Thermoanaerobaculia bacterium]|nr:hypothetical protein [Thermoanaerobaculia bacterium]
MTDATISNGKRIESLPSARTRETTARKPVVRMNVSATVIAPASQRFIGGRVMFASVRETDTKAKFPNQPLGLRPSRYR